jgi:hypothetical protein
VSLPTRLLDRLDQVLKTLAELWKLALALLGIRRPPAARRRKLRPWMLVRRAKAGQKATHTLEATEADKRRLLERMRLLEDSATLSKTSVGFTGGGEDFLAKPREVESLVLALVEHNPPFLHVAREGISEGEREQGDRRTETIVREVDLEVTEPMQLFIPKFGVEHLESRRPPGNPVLRPARSLADLRSAPLLYQSLDQDLTIARLLAGDIPVVAYREARKQILFDSEDRIVTRLERRVNRVPVEIEAGGESAGSRLVYLLMDRSTSLVRACQPRGCNAVMELAIAVAMARADLGRPYAKYFFRTFADRIWPLPQDDPITAVSVAEKDDLVRRMFEINFSGEATRVVDALECAVDDIERMKSNGSVNGAVPHIALLTDGRFTLYSSVASRLKRAGISLDTILIGKEASKNGDLCRISSTVSLVDPELYRTAALA